MLRVFYTEPNEASRTAKEKQTSAWRVARDKDGDTDKEREVRGGTRSEVDDKSARRNETEVRKVRGSARAREYERER